MVDHNRLDGGGGQFRGSVEQTVGVDMGWKETQARDEDSQLAEWLRAILHQAGSMDHHVGYALNYRDCHDGFTLTRVGEVADIVRCMAFYTEASIRPTTALS